MIILILKGDHLVGQNFFELIYPFYLRILLYFYSCITISSSLLFVTVVVGVEREPEPVSVVFRRICEDGERVPMKMESLTTPEWFDAEKFKK